MRPAEQLLGRAGGWLFGVGEARRLAALRIGLCLLLAVRLVTRDFGSLTGDVVPFRPHFYMDVFPGMPSDEVAAAVQVFGVVAALLAAAGVVLRVSLPVAFLSALVLNGMLNSAGRVIVGDALLMLCLLVLIAAGAAAGEAWSLPVGRRRGRVAAVARGARYGWPVHSAMVVVVLAYFFAGLQKWRYSGLAWVTSANLRWILYAASDAQRHPNGLALFVADRPLLAHVLAAGALLLETSFPLILFLPRLRWPFIAAAGAMHLGIWMTLRLDYSSQWLTTVIVFADWPLVVARVRRSVAQNRAVARVVAG